MKQLFTPPSIYDRFLLILMLSLSGFIVPVVQAQTIVPTQTDEIIIDNGASGKADPNDRIRYKVTIQNTGGPDGTNMQLNIVPDPRTTFVMGSFRSSPLAINDAYNCTGNVGLNVAAASGLLSNDFDDNSGMTPMSATAGTFATVAGGSIMIAADGGFMYTPPAGFTGSDSYTYTLNDGNPVGLPVPLTDMATVTFTVINLIWFIDNSSVAATSDGRLTSPFKTLADFNAGSATAGDVIYIEHTGTNYTGGIVLQDGERLFGEGHTGAANLSGVLPFALPPNSKALPAINGSRPVIENAAGDGVSLAMNNPLRGFTVGNCSDFGMDNILTNSVGNLIITEVNISNGIGGGFEAANGSSSVTNVTFDGFSTTGGTYGVNLTSFLGSFTILAGTITNPATAGVFISGGSVTFSTAGSINTNAGFVADIDNHDGAGATATFSGAINSTGMGIRIQNCDNSTKTFSNASKVLSTGTNTAVDLNTNTGSNINFTGGGLAITTTSGTGFTATGAGTITVTGTGNTISKSGNGAALNIANVNAGAGNINFASINVTGGTGTAVSISASTGTKNLGDVDVARGGGGTGIFAANAGTLNTTDGTINSGNQTAINISTTALGVVLTSVSANGVGGPTGRGIDLLTTTGSFTINGSGATNGSGGTIQNITQRGASFESATNITLKNMAFNDANTLDAAICDYANATNCNGALYMRNITTLVLDNVDVDDTEEQGLNGENINGMTVTNCLFTNCGTAQEEGCMKIRNLSGTCSFTGSVFSFGWEELVEIYNQAGSAALTLTVNNCDFTDTQFSANGERGLWVEFSNSVTSTVNVHQCDFLRVRTQGTRLNANGSATVNYNVTESNFDRVPPGIGSGVTAVMEGDANANININRNTMNMINDNAITVEIRGTSNVDARVNNNTINGPGINSGIIGEGIFFNAQDQGFGRAEIKDNTLTAIGGSNQRGIIAISRLNATLHAIIDNNNIGIGGTLPSRPIYAIEVRSGSGEAFPENSRTCAFVHHNDIMIPMGQDLGAEFRVRKANDASIVELQPLTMAVNTSSTDIWNNNLNTTTQPPPTISESVTSGTVSYTGACQAPVHPTAYTDPTENRPGSRLLKLNNSERWAAKPEENTSDSLSLHK